MKLKCCPYCGSESGYYMFERVHRYLYFDFAGESVDASEDVGEYYGTRKRCADCEKVIPKKYFNDDSEF